MNLKPMALALIAVFSASIAHAEPLVTITIPRVSCRAPACEAVGTAQLSAFAPVGTQLRRWDGATFTTQTAGGPGAVLVSSGTAIYDVPAGETLTGPLGLTATVTERIARYAVGDSAGPVRFQGLAISLYATGPITNPAAISLSYSDDYPAEFLRAVRQYNLTRSLVSGARLEGLSLSATQALVEASLIAPRPAATDSTREAATGYAHGDTGRTIYPAPLYTEPRIAGPLNTRQAIAECVGSTGSCTSRVGYVRPDNLYSVSFHCRPDGGGIDGDCPWLRAHEFTRHYGVNASLAGRCLADPAEPQRVFFGYIGDSFGCRYVYGGDLLPPEAEELIFEIVFNDLQ